MSIDSMRVGGGRCPSLLVGGLLVACLMLICNWWTLSSENIELVRQIDELNEQLKISAEERDQCVTLRGSLEQRYKHTEDELASLHVRLEQQADLKKKNDDLEDSVTMCKSELDSLKKVDATKSATLETLRLEKDTVNKQLDAKREAYQKLQEDLQKVQDDLDKAERACKTSVDKKLEHLVNLKPSMKPANDTLSGIEMLLNQPVEETEKSEPDNNLGEGGQNANDDILGESDRDLQMQARNETEKLDGTNK